MHDILIGLLQRQHQQMREILSRMADGPGDNPIDRQGIATQLDAAMRPHQEAEQAVLLPPLRDKDGGRELALEAFEQHLAARELLAEIRTIAPKGENWKAKVRRLKKTIEQHTAFEEQEVFPKVRTLITESVAGQILSRLQSEQNRVLLQVHARL